jgi:hypothetical protein
MAGEEVGLEKLTGGLTLASAKAGVMDIAQYVIWGLVILGVVIFAYLKYQDKKIFIYPVRIFRQRHNGIVKEQNTFGGYTKKGNFTQFQVKMGRFKKKTLNTLPVSDMMDEDNRIYYMQLSPDAPLVQVRRDFFIDKVTIKNEAFEATDELKIKIINKFLMQMQTTEGYKELDYEQQKDMAIQLAEDYIESQKNIEIDVTKPTYTPVATDLKQSALMEIQSYKNTLGVDVNKQFAYFIVGVIALVIVGVIIFYVAVNQGDIPILTK